MMTQGLSLTQAPPYGTIWPFFMGAIVWGVVCGGMICFLPFQELFEGGMRTFAILHGVAIGIFMSVMMGAMFQMSPVLVGVSVSHPSREAKMIFGLIHGGGIALVAGFWWGEPLFFESATVLLGGGIFLFLWSLRDFFRLSLETHTGRGMRYALLSLGVGGTLGMTLLLSLSHEGAYVFLAPLHGMWMGYGWVAILLMAVSYQVISMFYVTPSYPLWCMRFISPMIVSLLVLLALSVLNGGEITILSFFLNLVLIGWGSVTLKRISQRKRGAIEPPLALWIMGVLLVVGSALMMAMQSFGFLEGQTVLFFILGLCGVWSIMQGMIFKILPFLTWFHLSNQGHFDAPMMRELIPPREIKRVLFVWSVAILLGVMLPFHQNMVLAGGGIIVSFAILGYTFLMPIFIYYRYQKGEV